MSTRTYEVAVRLEEGSGRVEWSYDLDLAGESVGSYRLCVDIERPE